MATDENPFATRRRTSARAFQVIVQGVDDDNKATRQVIASVATEGSAIKRLVQILLQWEASHGAIRPGTTVSVIHMHDGGKVLSLEYLGYQETLI
jgi:hypothetical protein